MALRKGFPAKLAGTDANDARYDFNNLVVCNADGTPRGGVTAPLTSILSATATMNVAVAAFAGVAVRDGGTVFLADDGPHNVLLDPAPPANSRIDVIYAMQHDSSGTVTTPDADNNAVVTFAKGTASATPVAPSIPAGALNLGQVLIPSTATATNSSGVVISLPAQYTAASGGIVPFPTLVGLKAWSTARECQYAYAMDTDQTFEYLSGAATPGWFHVSGKPTVDSFGFTTIYASSATAPASLKTRNGRVFSDGAFTTSSGATFAAATTYTVGTVPSALAPAAPVKFTATWGGTGLVSINIATDGTITILFTTAPGTVSAGALQVYLSGMNWPLKSL